MVSRAAPSSRERLLAAAAAEFAARGFDGAKVDRIAARARVNKAMLYYHFRNKAALYREILRNLFASVARAVAAVRDRGAAPEAQLRDFISVVAHEAVARPHVPAMWLREIAEGGRHLDASIVGEMRRVIETLGAILQDGHDAGVFGRVNPFITQIGIVAPLLFFEASAPIRDRFQRMIPAEVAHPSRDAIVGHVQEITLAALTRRQAQGDPDPSTSLWVTPSSSRGERRRKVKAAPRSRSLPRRRRA